MRVFLSDQIGRLSGRWWAMIAALFALGVSSLFGGLRPAVGIGVPETAVGRQITGAPWNVTINSARVLADSQNLPTKKPGDHWIFVLATVEVTSDETRSDLADVLRLEGVPGIEGKRPAHTVLIRDNQDTGFLNPGMPERIAFGWEQAASTPIPTSVEVDVYNLTLRHDTLTGNSDSGELRWTDPAVKATVTVSVQDKRS